MSEQQRLSQFPRPPGDNGRGLHATIDVREVPNHPSISTCLEHLKQFGAKWTVWYAGDELQAQLAANLTWQAGIMPVIRPKALIDGASVVWEAYCEELKKNSIPCYIQIYNEPGDPREWRSGTPGGYEKFFAARWVEAANRVIAAGGFPGLQILGKEEWDAVVLEAGGSNPLWQKAWFCLHNYGANHPPAYPYDDRNQKDHPGATILTDDTAVLNFLEYAKWMQDSLGFTLPIIGGEGGWRWGNEEDSRYPQILEEQHAQYHREMFDWFRTGILGNGAPLPDYLFCLTAFAAGGAGDNSWWE